MVRYIAVFLAPIILIAFGILIKYFKQYWLIAGYNTAPQAEKEKVNIEGLGSFMGNMMFLLAAINILGYLLSYIGYKLLGDLTWGLFIIVIIFIVIKAQSFNDKGSAAMDKKMNRTGIITMLVVALPILIFVFGLIGYGSTMNEVAIEGELIQIKGLYGTAVAREAITSIELIDEIPKIERKLNGFDFGNITKGVFRLKDWGDGYIFLEAYKGPYILIRYNERGFILINYKDSADTERVYNMLADFYEK